MRRTLGLVLISSLVLVACNTPYDFDDDGDADYAFVDSGEWYRVGEPEPFWDETAEYLGGLADVPGDYDGDGVWEAATVGPGVWITDGPAGHIPFDYPGPVLWEALAVPGDYDGDGDTDPAFYDLDDGTWHIHAAPAVIDGGGGRDELGVLADAPVPADFDGDGTTDLGVYSPTERTITIPGQPTITGLPLGMPLTGELDGGPGVDLVFYQPAGARWVLQDGTVIDPPGTTASGSIVPTVADYDNNGTDELVLFNMELGAWISSTGDILASDPRAVNHAPTTVPAHVVFDFIRFASIQACLADPDNC